MVKALDLQSTGCGFESRPFYFHVTTWATYSRTCATVTKQYSLVPANGWWCSVAGKETVGLASHWPCISDSVVWAQSQWPSRGRWAPRLCSHTLPYLLPNSVDATKLSALRINVVIVWRWLTAKAHTLDCHVSEWLQYGKIEEMNVCDNLGDHLVGNVYIKVSRYLFIQLQTICNF